MNHERVGKHTIRFRRAIWRVWARVPSHAFATLAWEIIWIRLLVRFHGKETKKDFAANWHGNNIFRCADWSLLHVTKEISVAKVCTKHHPFMFINVSLQKTEKNNYDNKMKVLLKFFTYFLLSYQSFIKKYSNIPNSCSSSKPNYPYIHFTQTD